MMAKTVRSAKDAIIAAQRARIAELEEQREGVEKALASGRPIIPVAGLPPGAYVDTATFNRAVNLGNADLIASSAQHAAEMLLRELWVTWVHLQSIPVAQRDTVFRSWLERAMGTPPHVNVYTFVGGQLHALAGKAHSTWKVVAPALVELAQRGALAATGGANVDDVLRARAWKIAAIADASGKLAAAFEALAQGHGLAALAATFEDFDAAGILAGTLADVALVRVGRAADPAVQHIRARKAHYRRIMGDSWAKIAHAIRDELRADPGTADDPVKAAALATLNSLEGQALRRYIKDVGD